MITLKVNDGRLSARLPEMGLTMSARVVKSTVHHGQLLRTRVMAKASGRPGPNAPTGDYRRSIALEIDKTPNTIQARVGTNKPQGRRLEFGFVGTDSLGRTYNQPPYPHFGPASDEIGQLWVRDLEDIVTVEANK